MLALKKFTMGYLIHQVKIGYVLYCPYRANVPIPKAVHSRHEGHLRSVNGVECRSNHIGIFVRYLIIRVDQRVDSPIQASS
jgi:hypothetical protein